MNTTTLDRILDGFKMRFPGLAEKMIGWYPSGQLEVTVKLDDGTKVKYYALDNSLQYIYRTDEETEDISECEMKQEFAIMLKKKMQLRGVTQKDLAEMCGISQIIVNKYVKGESLPGLYIANKLAHALHCSISDFVYYD